MDQEVSMHRIPGRADRRWDEPTWGQGVWLLVFAACAYLLYKAYPNTAGTFAAVIVLSVGVIGAIPYREGPGYKVVADNLKSRFMRKNAGEIYSTDLADTLYEAGKERRAPKSLPGVKLQAIPARDSAGTLYQLGLLHTPDTGHDVTVLAADGWGEAAMSDLPERMALDENFAAALRRMANRSRAELTLAMFFMRRRADKMPTIAYAGRRQHPDISFPQGQLDPDALQSVVDSELAANASEAIDSIYGDGAKVTAGIALRAPRPKDWAKRDLSNLSQQDIDRAPLVQMLNVLAADLRAIGVRGVRRLSLFNLNALVRSLFSTDLQAFYEDLAKDQEREQQGELSDLGEALTLARGPWPSQIYAHNDRLEADTTEHAVFWVTNFDQTRVPPGFFQELYNVDAEYLLSYYIETVAGRKELRRAKRRRRLVRRFHDLKEQSDDTSPEYDAAVEESTAQHYAAYRTASRGTRTRLMLVVSAPDQDDQLERDVELLEGVFRSKHMTLQRYHGEARQLRSLLAAIGVVVD